MADLKCVNDRCAEPAQYIDSGSSYCETHYKSRTDTPGTVAARWIYVAGIVGWAALWLPLLGWIAPNNWLHTKIDSVYADTKTLLLIPISMGFFVLILNLVLWWSRREFANYETEVKVIEFVERNAGWFLIASGTFLTSAAFFLTRPPGSPLPVPSLAREGILVVLSLEAMSLLCLLLVVTLFWTPGPKSLVRLRHLKTVPFTYAVALFAAAFITLVKAAVSS